MTVTQCIELMNEEALRAICRLWPAALGRIVGVCDPDLGRRVDCWLTAVDLGRVGWEQLAVAVAPCCPA